MRSLSALRAAMLLSVIFVSICLGLSMMPKPMYYVNTTTNKGGDALYWSIYLGQPQCTLDRKYPGEPMQKITSGINLNLLSNGYISCAGYSEKGKIDCSPVMKIKIDTTLRDLPIDSIDCIFDYGQKVRTTAGVVGDFIIEVEGNRVSADRFLLTEYVLLTENGEKTLKRKGDDIPISAIAFTKEGFSWAAETMARERKADSIKGGAH